MIKQYYHFSGLRFDKGRAIFKNIADQSVFLYDFEKYIDPNDYSNREKLHEAAFSALSKKLHKKLKMSASIRRRTSMSGTKTTTVAHSTWCLKRFTATSITSVESGC